MTDDASKSPTAEADQSVERLCGEVSLLRRAIEGLAAERQAAPDYGPTLDSIDDRMTQFAGWARRVAETPLLRMTPATLEAEIARVAISTRQADRETIQRYDASMAAAIQGVQRVTDSAWKASDQRRALLIAAAISAVMAAVLTLALIRLFISDVRLPMSPALAPVHVAADHATPQQATPPVHHRHHSIAPTAPPGDHVSKTSVD